MPNDFQHLFDQLPTSEPVTGLLDQVMNRIARRQKISVLLRGLFFSITLIGSIVTFIPVIRSLMSNLASSGFLSYRSLMSNLASSGFLSYFSLILSDAQVVLASWQSFGLALLESVPLLSIVLTLAVLLVFLESLKYLLQTIKPFSAAMRMTA
jgi:hypothetical protein